jgi:hypothetical protein
MLIAKIMITLSISPLAPIAMARTPLQPLAPVQCPTSGMVPTILSAVGPELTESTTPVPGMDLPLANLGELYLICQTAGQDRSLKTLSISTLRSDGVSFTRDPNSLLLSFDQLRLSGHTYHRSVPLYGNVLVSQMFCPGCSTQNLNHHFKIRLLRKFSLFGSSYHDYREIPFSMTYHEDQRHYYAERGGVSFQLAVSYPGTWGVEKVAFARCKTPDPIACIRESNSTLVITEVLSLGSQKSVRVD